MKSSRPGGDGTECHSVCFIIPELITYYCTTGKCWWRDPGHVGQAECDCLIGRQHPDTRSRLALRASADGLKSVSCPESLWSSVGRSHNGCRRQGNYGHGGGLHGPVHSHTLHLLVPFPFRLQLWLGELLIWLFLQILWLLLRLLFNWLLRCRKRLLISSSNLLLITRLFITR